MRYARGEITQEEYPQKRQTLGILNITSCS
ncbi:hypothetical protein HOB36_00375 [Candidatus Bathyarchaeota archaeon]|nr:hypothetical protein [Candidatus Bathyarchaeota archaeon]